MRFPEKFSYELQVEQGIDTEKMKIPPMILQPYIENSIWHGILPMEKTGKITVNVKQTDRNIVFNIYDNGIGIDKSMENKGKYPTEHDSQGMKITENRINLLKKITNSSIRIIGPLDVKNDKGESTGTNVEIILPVEQ